MFFLIGLAVGGFVYVLDALIQLVVFGVDALHIFDFSAAIGMMLKGKCFILPFQFFNAVDVLEKFETHNASHRLL